MNDDDIDREDAMRRIVSGSYALRSGSPWTRRHAEAEHRAADHKPSTTAGSSEPQAAPSDQAMRVWVEANLCPYCGAGPYRNLGLHTNLAHGVSAQELRDLTGLAAVCAESLSAQSRERLATRDDHDEMLRRAAEAAHQRKGQGQTERQKAARADLLRQRDERDLVITERALRGDRLDAIAADLGVSTQTVHQSMKRTGTKPALTEANAGRRARLAAHRAEAVAATRERLAREAESRLARYAALGSDWTAIHTLAEEWRVSTKSAVAWLRKQGAAVPDGRTAPNPFRWGRR